MNAAPGALLEATQENVGVRLSERLHAALPAGLARLERFPDCGHEVVNDDPEGCFRLVKGFIAGG